MPRHSFITPITWCLMVITIGSFARGSDLETDWHAFVSNDMRVTMSGTDAPAFYRNDSGVGLTLKADLIPYELQMVGDIQLWWTGFTEDQGFVGLTTREGVSPYYIESDAAYIELLDLLPNLDLKIGRQIVQWGSADMFNPTNNLNAIDLEDPLMFGKTIANQMVRLDWSPGDGNFIGTAVFVPMFQPAQLPKSALKYIGDVQAEFPFVDPDTRLEAERLRNIYLKNEDNFVVEQPDVVGQMPGHSLKNGQIGLRAQWLVGTVDTSISYYVGRDSLPVTKRSYSTMEPTGDYNNGTPVNRVYSDVKLVYPKKQVLGFDFAGQIPFLDDMGFWFEGAITFPQAVKMAFDITQIVPTAKVIEDYVVKENPFFKCTAGVDYAINRYLYVNGQFIHGFPDEFGPQAIQNYWMAMIDLKLLQDRITIRNVALGEIPHQDTDRTMDDDHDGLVESLASGATNDGRIASLVYYPELIAKPKDGLELSVGAFLRWGHKESKFAQPAAGPAQAFFRIKASF